MNQENTGTDQVRSVDVPTLLASIAKQLTQNQGHLNQVDRTGTHGERIAQAFTAAAQAAANTGGDAGAQLQAAAQAMKTQGSGKATQFYANGLQSAAQQFAGQTNISSDNLAQFLQSFVGGVQRNNPAKPGQGTMIDALNPALNALTSAQSSGQDTIGAMSSALGAAITGTQRTAGTAGRVDPGAASATNVLGGIFAALAPTLLSVIMNRVTGSGQSQQGGFANSPGGAGGLGALLGGLLGGGASGASQGNTGGGLGSMLGDLMGGGGTAGSSQSQGSSGPDLGGLLGGLLGGSGGGNTAQSTGGTDWVGGLLGGLMGGGQGSSGTTGSGDPLGGLLGGLMGGGQGSGTDTAGNTGTTLSPDQSQNAGDSGLGGLLGGMFGGNKGNQG